MRSRGIFIHFTALLQNSEFDELILYLFFTSTNLPTLKYHSIAMIFSALISQFTINYSQDFG
nr:MAG TPA: hypothetical protein [Caudoviricetes sp.]DAV96525.1 MAG TPA: hypothetical protein [Caudoviricetes sp.]